MYKGATTAAACTASKCATDTQSFNYFVNTIFKLSLLEKWCQITDKKQSGGLNTRHYEVQTL